MIPRTPGICSLLFPKILFRVDTHGAPDLYLTFDDGPHPEATAFVLDCLAAAGAGATFFTVGQNVDRYPQVMERIRSEGHTLGHHTDTHADALRTDRAAYLRDVETGAAKNPSAYFRPPYGKLTPGTYRALKKRYRIVLWDVISEDYDRRYTAEACIRKVVRQVRPGSVVVLHDNPKCLDRLRVILPEILKILGDKGYAFRALGTGAGPNP